MIKCIPYHDSKYYSIGSQYKVYRTDFSAWMNDQKTFIYEPSDDSC